jgi:hypothetical protein
VIDFGIGMPFCDAEDVHCVLGIADMYGVGVMEVQSCVSWRN